MQAEELQHGQEQEEYFRPFGAQQILPLLQKAHQACAKAVTAVKKEDTELGFFEKIGKWFREMKSELKKVVWPTPKALRNNTLISIGMMCISAVVIWGFDEFAQMVVRLIFRLV